MSNQVHALINNIFYSIRLLSFCTIEMINLANLGILFLLFTFLGLPWLFIVTGSLMSITLIDGIRHAVTIIDALQGPALFVIRVG